MLTTAIIAAPFVLAIGCLILWSNPGRGVNRTVFICSLCIAGWLSCLHGAMAGREHAVQWIRYACALGGAIPLMFRLLQRAIADDGQVKIGRWILRNLPYIAGTLFLVAVPFTEYFIPSTSTATNRVRGPGYTAYMVVDVVMFVAILVAGFVAVRKLTGSRRLELQVWLLGGCAMTMTILGLMILNAVTHNRIYIKIQPLLVLGFYAGTVFAITTHRIFDARQLLLVAAHKTLLVASVAAVAFVSDATLGNVFPDPFGLFATVALALWFAWLANQWLDQRFRFYPHDSAVRKAAFAVARRELRTEVLEKAFAEILRGWSKAEYAVVLYGTKGAFQGGDITIAEGSGIGEMLQEMRWVTPERLARERSSPEREQLARFLTTHRLGVLVAGEGATLTVAVGLGVPPTRRPYTYPQVQQLTEIASIIESAIERAHFSRKAQHAEQLAAVGLLGASLAHEIRNPLVTIKTFVQLLPRYHQEAAFRDKFFNLIGEEVTRIDRLTEQLLDLATPRVYDPKPMELHPVLRTTAELVAAKASGKSIEFFTQLDASPDLVVSDPSALKQVVINLCFNAIQAVERQEGTRWVKLATRNVDGGVEMVVEDNGPGISPAIRPRLFQPFQSTKSSGFGLGLAICNDILTDLDASIAVDATEPGRGAVFRVVMPCPA